MLNISKMSRKIQKNQEKIITIPLHGGGGQQITSNCGGPCLHTAIKLVATNGLGESAEGFGSCLASSVWVRWIERHEDQGMSCSGAATLWTQLEVSQQCAWPFISVVLYYSTSGGWDWGEGWLVTNITLCHNRATTDFPALLTRGVSCLVLTCGDKDMSVWTVADENLTRVIKVWLHYSTLNFTTDCCHESG